MAALGVKTLYVQVANPDGAPSNQLTDRAELRALLERAHDHDMDRGAVVPARAHEPGRRSRGDEADPTRCAPEANRSTGSGSTSSRARCADIAVAQPARRSTSPVRSRRIVGDSMPVAAIVYPAVQLEVLNTTLWPDFPYRKVATASSNVWMPMSVLHVPIDRVGVAERVPVHRRQRRPAPPPPGRRRRAGAPHRRPGRGQHARRLPRHRHVPHGRPTRSGWSVYDYATTGTVGVAVPPGRGSGPHHARTAHHDRARRPSTSTTAPPATTVVPASSTTVTPPTSPP